VIKASGPDHSKKFIVDVLVSGKPKGRGMGKNKSSAAQAAAKNALTDIL
jgi:ribonuclease-3